MTQMTNKHKESDKKECAEGEHDYKFKFSYIVHNDSVHVSECRICGKERD